MTDETKVVPIPVNFQIVPQMEHGDLGFGDMEAAFNMRDWLQQACEAKGAKMIGGGFGGGVADIDILLDGCKFNLTISHHNLGGTARETGIDCRSRTGAGVP